MRRLWAAAVAVFLAFPAWAVVNTTTSVVEYTCNGVTKAYSVPFKFLASSDLLVYRVLVAAPYTATLLTQTTDYTVSGALAEAGGTVTLVTPASSCASSSYKLRIKRATSRTQGTKFSAYSAFPSSTVERALDRATMLAQEAADSATVGVVDYSADASGGQVTAVGSTTARRLDVRLAETINVKDYGAVGDGVTDDTAAINAALAVGKTVFFPDGTYLATSLTMAAGSSLIGANKLTTTIKRISTSDFITSLPAGAVIRDITLDGNASVYASGKGVLVVAGQGRQTIDNARLRNWPSTVLEFAADGGSEFKAVNATFATTGAQGTVAAVVIVPSGADSAAVPRHFKSIESEGCTLFSFGGVNHVWASGFYTNGLLFASASAFNIEMREFRCGALGGTITVQGDSHFMSGVSAVPWIIRSTSSIYDVQTPGWELTESSPAANNSINIIHPTGGAAAWNPTLTAAGGGFTMGATTVTGRYSRRGAWIRLEAYITLGAGFSIGTGTLQVSLPATAINVSPTQICGTAYLRNNAASSAAIGAVQVAGGATVLTIKTATTDVGSFGPFTFDAGSVIGLSCEYRVQ